VDGATNSPESGALDPSLACGVPSVKSSALEWCHRSGLCHDVSVSSPESLPRAVRRRGREEITQQIVAAARRHLAVEGAPGLSLRAVARELGMVSSAVYRYVAGRDELLTLLIIDAYDALGAAVEDAEGRVPRADLAGRWAAACHGVRGWALAHPHEYALLYGSPVPGYAAPVTTIGPATRVTMVLSRLIGDAVPAVPGASAAGRDPLDAPWRAALAPVRRFVPPEVPDEVLVGGLLAWTYLFGAVYF